MKLKNYKELKTEADIKQNAEIVQKRLNDLETMKVIPIDNFDCISIELLQNLSNIDEQINHKKTLMNTLKNLLKSFNIGSEHQKHLIELMDLIDQFELVRNRIIEEEKLWKEVRK